MEEEKAEEREREWIVRTGSSLDRISWFLFFQI